MKSTWWNPDDMGEKGSNWEKELLGGLVMWRIITIPSQESLDSVFWREKFMDGDEANDETKTLFYDIEDGDYNITFDPGEELQLVSPRADGTWFCRLAWLGEDESENVSDIIVPEEFLKTLIWLVDGMEAEKLKIDTELEDALILFREKFGTLLWEASPKAATIKASSDKPKKSQKIDTDGLDEKNKSWSFGQILRRVFWRDPNHKEPL
jgi:hypothetical protein